MAHYLISVDWFQVTCTRNPNQAISEGMFFQGTHKNPEGRTLLYMLKSGREFNALFGNCLDVYLHDFKCATIYCEPRPGTMSPKVCMVKMANPILYSARWCWYLEDIMSALKWEYNNISRIDVCADFNTFYNGLDPREFIRRFMYNGPYSPYKPSYVRVGGNKYETIGRKEVVSEVFSGSSENFSRHTNEYLRFGKRSSGVATYLYNKTLELDQVSGKKYIRDLWREGGLSDSQDKPVYRLEFSISPSATNVRVKRTDEERDELAKARNLKLQNIDRFKVRSLAMDDFGTQQAIENVFWAYCSHYFRFKIVGQQKTQFHWKDVLLFETSFTTQMKPYRVSKPLESGVAEDNALKRLEKILYSTPELSVAEAISIDNTIRTLRRLTEDKKRDYDPVQVDAVIRTLNMGADWKEVARRRLMPIEKLEKIKAHVEQESDRELQRLIEDPFIRQAIDEREAQLAIIADLADQMALCENS